MFIESTGCVFLLSDVCVDLLGRQFWPFLEDNTEAPGFTPFIRFVRGLQ